MARSDYRKEIQFSADNIIDSIESDVNDILSSAEEIKEILAKGEGGLAYNDVRQAMSEIEEVIDMLEELADKLYQGGNE